MRPFCSGREQVWRGSYQSSGQRKEEGVQPPRRHQTFPLPYSHICDRAHLDMCSISYMLFIHSLITANHPPPEVGEHIADGNHFRHQGNLSSHEKKTEEQKTGSFVEDRNTPGPRLLWEFSLPWRLASCCCD